jgi:hypothetical protein
MMVHGNQPHVKYFVTNVPIVMLVVDLQSLRKMDFVEIAAVY